MGHRVATAGMVFAFAISRSYVRAFGNGRGFPAHSSLHCFFIRNALGRAPATYHFMNGPRAPQAARRISSRQRQVCAYSALQVFSISFTRALLPSSVAFTFSGAMPLWIKPLVIPTMSDSFS